MTDPAARLVTPSEVARAVPGSEYGRLLGYPPGRPLTGEALALAKLSRSWYERHCRPWVHGRMRGIASLDGPEVLLQSGHRFESTLLARRLERAEATALVAAAVSAGPEVDERVADLWTDNRPDEAYFLDRFSAAVAEYLAAWCGATLRETRAGDELVALPGCSPGYSGWDLTQQTVLHELLLTDPVDRLPGPLDVLPSGMLDPKGSLLAIFGLTAKPELANEAWARGRCAWCSLPGCSFRRKTTGIAATADSDSG